MKKLLAVMALFLLVGCSDAYANTSTNDVLFKVNDTEVKKNDLFAAMKAADSGRLAIEEGQAIITKDITDEEIMDDVNSKLAQQKEDLGDLFETQVKSLGFLDENDYVERSLKPYFRLQATIRKELANDYSEFATNYQPKDVQILQLTSREKADEVLALLNDGTDFDAIDEDYLSGTTYTGEQKIYMMNDTSIPAEVSNFILETNTAVRSEVIETETGEVKYFIVNVIEPDVTKIQDKAIDAALEDSELTQKYIAKMYKDAGFKVYDKTIYDILQSDFKDYLAN